MLIPIVVLLAVFALIAVRKVGSVRLQIWQIMLLGAVAVLATGQISPLNAVRAINVDVMFFLLGMFVVGRAMEESGYLSYLAHRLFSRAKTVDQLVLFILFGMGISSAFLLNDTLAIIGTPVALLLAKAYRLKAKLLLIALAFSVTIGSAMSPIGNPQNLLIAINSNIANPFLTFFKFLLLPTVLNLFLAYLLLKFFYRREFSGKLPEQPLEPISDPKLAQLNKVSLALIVALVAAKMLVVFLNVQVDFKLTYIALVAALPVAFSPKRLKILREIDWSTLVFFASMFVLMESVWETGLFQSAITGFNINITSLPMILLVSVALSQFISNVPLVALYLPLLVQAGASTSDMVALAAGSTIAGNLSILGAASNVIIIQNAEKKENETLTFLEFVKIGVPLTVTNLFIYWLFLRVI